MSLLIATPMYGSQCHAAYFQSALALKEEFVRAGIEHDWLTTTNESLITRARNTSVATFLQTGYRKLLFIDADIEFDAYDVSLLWNADADVIAGAYRMKREDAPPVSVWVDGQLQEVFGEEPYPVDYAGTGFMMIDRRVFTDLMEAHPEWRYEEGKVGECWAFFQDPIEDGIQISEDYYFCARWRERGGQVLVHPGVQLVHWGQYGY